MMDYRIELDVHKPTRSIVVSVAAFRGWIFPLRDTVASGRSGRAEWFVLNEIAAHLLLGICRFHEFG